MLRGMGQGWPPTPNREGWFQSMKCPAAGRLPLLSLPAHPKRDGQDEPHTLTVSAVTREEARGPFRPPPTPFYMIQMPPGSL